MPHYRIEALVESEQDEESLADYAEDVLRLLDLKDLSVYEVLHMPGHGRE